MAEVDMRKVLASVAPGTELGDALERILRGQTGALIVLGFDKTVASLCSGGFVLDVEFTAQRLRELAKMDGAVVVDTSANRIVRAGVQLLPDPTILTAESGTRHRTAERVAKQTRLPVISVSQSMRLVAVYVGDQRHVLAETTELLGRTNQALATLERYSERLQEVAGMLSALEVEDLVTVKDVCVVIQRAEMVRRIIDEIEGYMVELGSAGRLAAMQLAELVAGIGRDGELVRRDYAHEALSADANLAALSSTELFDLGRVARTLGLPSTTQGLDHHLAPKGYRILARIPRLPMATIERLTSVFGDLQHLLAATIEDLLEVEGIGEQRARSIREHLSRLADSSILERYI